MRFNVLSSDAAYFSNVLVVCIDADWTEDDKNYRYLVDRLRSRLSDVVLYNDLDVCLDALTDIDDQQVLLIVSEDIAPLLVLKIHCIPHLIHIYIFRKDLNETDEWFRPYSKVQNAYTDIIQLGNDLEVAIENCKHDSMPISLLPIETGVNSVDSNFILAMLLLRIFARIGPAADLAKITERSAIRTYISDNSTYQMVNRSLRNLDIDQLFQTRAFLCQLSCELKNLRAKQCSIERYDKDTLTVYRGQRLSIIDFEKIHKNSDGMLSFNSFLSTSTQRDIPLRYATSAATCSDLCGVLFVINISSSTFPTRYADIRHISDYPSEAEVLIYPYTMFRIEQLSAIDRENRIFQVNLTRSPSDIEVIQPLLRRCEFILQSSQAWDELRVLDGVQMQLIKLFRENLKQLTSIYFTKGAIPPTLQQQFFALQSICKKLIPDQCDELFQSYSKLAIPNETILDYMQPWPLNNKTVSSTTNTSTGE